MNKTLKDIKKNDRVQNQLALYILLQFGRKTILDDKLFSKMRKETGETYENNKFITKEYIQGALDISKDLAKLSHNDIYKFIYNEVKEQKGRKGKDKIWK